MIAPSSLSAFSASIANGGLSAGSGVQPARAQARAQGAPVAPPPAPAQAAPPGLAPGQKLPRGSLLDLSV